MTKILKNTGQKNDAENELDSVLKRTIAVTEAIQKQEKKPGRNSKTHEKWIALRAEMEKKKFGYLSSWFDYLFDENWRRALAGAGAEMEEAATDKWKSDLLRKVSPMAIKKVVAGIADGKLWKSPFPPKPFEFLEMCRDTKITDAPDPFVDELGFYSDDETDAPLQAWTSKYYWEIHPICLTFSNWIEGQKDPYFKFVYPDESDFCKDVRIAIYSRGLEWLKSELGKLKLDPGYRLERFHEGPKFNDRETLKAWEESDKGVDEKAHQRPPMELWDAGELVAERRAIHTREKEIEQALEVLRLKRMKEEKELAEHYEKIETKTGD